MPPLLPVHPSLTAKESAWPLSYACFAMKGCVHPGRSIGRILACCLLTVCLQGALTVASRAQPTGSGPWPTSAEDAQGIETGTFNALVEKVNSDPRFDHALALLLVRHGTLVGETYFNGAQPGDLNDLRSVTKSVVSMAMGIAIARGEVPPVNARIRELLPSYASRLEGRPQSELNLEQVLTMQAGFEWDDAADPWLSKLFTAPDLVDYLFSQPTVADPGTVFEYSTALTQVLAKVLIERTGMPLHDYVTRRLFRPIGIHQSAWLVRPSGDHYGGLGMQITARDMARLGQLALQRGYWSGQQVVGRQWMDRSIRDFRGDTFGYGYQWWRLGPERFTAIGYGGQYVDIDRTMDTVLCLVVDWNVPATKHLSLASFDQLRGLLQAGLVAQTPSTVVLRNSEGESPIELLVRETDEPTTTDLFLHREGSAEGALTVRIDTRRGSAKANQDFLPVAQMVRWEDGDSSVHPIDITVLDDDFEEPEERFFLDIERITGNGQVAASSLPIRIAGSNQPTTVLSWQPSFLILTEGQTADLTLHRTITTAAIDIPATIRHITSNPEDLGSPGEPISFHFAAGSASAMIELAALSDQLAEPSEVFELQLSGDTSKVQLPAPLSAVIRDQQAASCQTQGSSDSDPACFLAGRYRAEVIWLDPRSGNRGLGLFSPLVGFPDTPSAESAQVSFFGPSNVELLLKVIDGTSLTGSAWVFFGKLSDLPVWVVVTDLQSGKTALWSSANGSLCGVADVSAFAEAPPSEVSSFDLPVRSLPANTTASCPAGALCLQDRFEVRVHWETSSDSGTGIPVPASPESGAFWFFSPANVEVGVKILDGRAINDHFWFFSGALTDQNYTIDILDTETSESWSFENRRRDLCGIAEISQL